MDDNTFKILKSLIDSIPALVGGLGAIVASYFSYRTHAISRETQQIALTTEKNTNSMKDELVATTKIASFAAGRLAEKTNPGGLDVSKEKHEEEGH